MNLEHCPACGCLVSAKYIKREIPTPRDTFAAAALTGLLSTPSMGHSGNRLQENVLLSWEAAELMMAAREKK